MRVAFLLLALALPACRESVVTGDPPVQPGRPATQSPTPDPGGEATPVGVTLALGQEAQVPGEPVRIAFLEVLEDSRCPADVTCVWAGNAKIRLGIRIDGGARETLELNTTTDPRNATRGGYVVVLQDVKPEPVSTHPIPEGEYGVRVVVGGT